jgi:hypothetical protein
MSQIALRQSSTGRIESLLDDLNGRYHRPALWAFMLIVVAHWAEHVVQAFQVFVLGWERPASRGVLGLAFPWLVSSEALHYFYAIVMLVALVLLRPGFTGTARTWWNVALGIQFWHHIEHALLLGQVVLGANLLGKEVPTSVAQLFVMRVELHLFYNAAVFIPMVVAMIYHVFPSKKERHEVSCTCARETRKELVGSPAGA